MALRREGSPARLRIAARLQSRCRSDRPRDRRILMGIVSMVLFPPLGIGGFWQHELMLVVMHELGLGLSGKTAQKMLKSWQVL